MRTVLRSLPTRPSRLPGAPGQARRAASSRARSPDERPSRSAATSSATASSPASASRSRSSRSATASARALCAKRCSRWPATAWCTSSITRDSWSRRSIRRRCSTSRRCARTWRSTRCSDRSGRATTTGRRRSSPRPIGWRSFECPGRMGAAASRVPLRAVQRLRIAVAAAFLRRALRSARALSAPSVALRRAGARRRRPARAAQEGRARPRCEAGAQGARRALPSPGRIDDRSAAGLNRPQSLNPPATTPHCGSPASDRRSRPAPCDRCSTCCTCRR